MKEQTQAESGESAVLSVPPHAYWASCLRYTAEYRCWHGSLLVPNGYVTAAGAQPPRIPADDGGVGEGARKSIMV